MTSRVSSTDAMRIEQVEARAWIDTHSAAPAAAITALGLRTRSQGAVALLTADRSESLLDNRAIGMGVLEPATDAMLDGVLQHYAHGATGFAINLSPFAQPADTAARLASRGLQTFFHHVKWIRGSGPAPSVVTRLRVTLASAADAGLYAATLHPEDAPDRAAQIEWTAAMVGRPGWGHVLAWDGDEPVAGAAVFVDGENAWLGHAHTREEFRRQGAQQALLAERIRFAAATGARLLTTETAPDWPDLPRESLRNVARAGFRVAYERPSWIRFAG